MRRLLALVAATVVAAAAAGTTDAAPAKLRLTELGGTTFPGRAYVLTLPANRAVTARDLRVSENGQPVTDLTVVPATELGEDEFALTLAIDASQSMKGRPIEAAMAAARAFASKRQPTQKLGAMVFNSDTDVLLPFTLEQEKIDAALAETPPVEYFTRTYDTLIEAIDMLEREGIKSASIVLLSDGQELDSRSTLDAVVVRARRARVRIFSIALRSRFFDATTLQTLASRTGGRYAEARSPDELSAIFSQLGSQLANEYLVRYRSLVTPSTKVVVKASVAGFGGTAEAGYVTPALPKLAGESQPAPPHHVSRWTSFWTSPFAMIAIALAIASVVGSAFAAAVRSKPQTLRNRVAQFVSVPAAVEDGRASALSTRMLGTAEESLRGMRWWARFNEELAIAEITIPALHIVLGTFVGTVFVTWLGFLVGGVFFAVTGVLVPLGVRWTFRRKLNRKRANFLEQLPDNLQVLASALRAGHSLIGALSVVVNDAPEPSKSEFRRAIADEQLGASLEDALTEIARRMTCRDLEQVALVAALGRDTGGNTAEVLDRLTETIRDRFELRRLVSTLTAQGRISRWIVSALPVGLLLVITVINPKYMEPMFTTGLGRFLLFFAAIMVVAGSLVIRRIVNIRV